MNEQSLTEVHELILEGAPERRSELEELWQRYLPRFERAADKKGFRLESGPWSLVVFTPRTTAQIWILGFAAWRAFEAYCPYLLLHVPIIPSAMSNEPDQVQFEKALNGDLLKVRELKNIENLADFAWPFGIPALGLDQPHTTKERAVIDLIKIATAFSFLHEIRHVMFAQDRKRPQGRFDEEYECDRYARSFLLDKVCEYCASAHENHQGVLGKRMMGIILGAFVILETTPEEKAAWIG